MVTIRIRDHVQLASSYDDGQVIYRLIADKISSGDTVEVSFDGINAVPSAFVNAAFLQLLQVAPMERVRERLKITNSTRFINELIKNRFDFVSKRTPHAA
jgi:ABC-type bacteriocin/lantibiotic exporter with double-glycine peptidase domain